LRSEDSPRAVALLVAAVILASLGLNVWFASEGLDSYRYWDERYTLNNVRGVLTTGSLEPSNVWYPSLSYLPQVALLAASRTLHRWTGLQALAILDSAGGFTPTAYLLCRLLQTLFGAACLLLVFRLGRRLFSPAAGVLGAFFLAVTPWFVQAATMSKPDILVMTAVLLALEWTCRAVSRPSAARFALAGLGAAIAASAKLNGAVVAAPVALGAFLAGGSRRNRFVRLLAAGAASAALFVALNPSFTLYAAPLAQNLDAYGDRAVAQGAARLAVLREEVRLVLSQDAHGPVVGLLALAGLGALAASLARGWRERTPEAAQRWVLLGFPVAYSLVWVAVTPGFRGNNFLPVLPVTSLLAGWAAVRGWRLAAARLAFLRRRWVVVSAVVLLAGALSIEPFAYVYRQRVPTTDELALAFLRRSFLAAGEVPGRWIYSEGAVEVEGFRRVMAPPYRVASVVVPVERLDLLEPGALDAADGEIFPVSWLTGEAAPFYRGRLATLPPEAIRRFEPSPFSARGRALMALSHPWRLVGPPQSIPFDDAVAGGRPVAHPLPAGLGPGEVVSFLAGARDPDGLPTLSLGRRRLRLGYVDPSDRPTLFLSERVVLGGMAPRYSLSVPRTSADARWRLSLLRWRRHSAAPEGAG
jgi:hypothetical protein